MEFSIHSISERDIPVLSQMNLSLIRDEGSRNPMGLPELEHRMRGFLAASYSGVLIRAGSEPAGYCLWRSEEGAHGGPAGIYLRQYYIKPEFRRQGMGRAALRHIMAQCFIGAAFISLDVLESNATGRVFWENLGFQPVYTRMNLNL